MQLAARLTAVLALLLALCAAFGAGTFASAESPGEIALTEGRNVVTWAGSEPYAIAHLQGTPVSQVHRWDPATQTWLSRFIGQDDATLPDRHLLPRVQYLLVADGAYELTIPNPLADVDPKAELRTSPPPETPLRFDAVWPNEYSPLEDLVVLRGDDQFLSVRARVTGSVGQVSVLWMIDGRLNHEGMVSDQVSLLPGGHDHGLVYAADESGQVAVAELPRVVRLPDLELPEMVYGVTAHIGAHRPEYPSRQHLEAAAKAVADAGLDFVRADISRNPSAELGRHEPFQRRGVGIMGIGNPREIEYTSMDLDLQQGEDHRERGVKAKRPAGMPPWITTSIDPLAHQTMLRHIVASLPDVTYYSADHEPNHTGYNAAIDPWASAAQLIANALAIWYENPNAIITGPAVGCSRNYGWVTVDEHGYSELTSCGEGVVADAYLQAMYDAGFGPYHDIGDHTHYSPAPNLLEAVELIRQVMIRNGDANKPLWVTETGWADHEGLTPEQKAHRMVMIMEALTEHPSVTGQFVYNFQDGADRNDPEHKLGIVFHGLQDGEFVPKPAYWAIREFLTGQPPPAD